MNPLPVEPDEEMDQAHPLAHDDPLARRSDGKWLRRNARRKHERGRLSSRSDDANLEGRTLSAGHSASPPAPDLDGAS